MAKGLDALIEELVKEIAYAGENGKEPQLEDARGYLGTSTRFIDETNLTRCCRTHGERVHRGGDENLDQG